MSACFPSAKDLCPLLSSSIVSLKLLHFIGLHTGYSGDNEISQKTSTGPPKGLQHWADSITVFLEEPQTTKPACLCPVVTVCTCDKNGHFVMVYKASTQEMSWVILFWAHYTVYNCHCSGFGGEKAQSSSCNKWLWSECWPGHDGWFSLWHIISTTFLV